MINRKTMLTQAIENGFDQTTEGYPDTLKYCKEKNAYDYTVYGNTVTGKNMLKATDFYSALQKDAEKKGKDLYYSELEEDGRNCVRFVDCWDAKYKILPFKENTQYTISMDCKTKNRGSGNTVGSALFVFFYTDGTRKQGITLAKDAAWTHKTATSAAGKTLSAIGLSSVNWTNWCYVDIDTFQFEEGVTATDYEPYHGSYVGDKTKNMLKATDFYSALQKDAEKKGKDLYYSELEEDGRNCVRFVDCWDAKYQGLSFKENTQYTISMDCKTVNRATGNTTGSALFVFFYTDGTYSDAISMERNTKWTHKTATSKANKTISAIGLRNSNYVNWCYVDIDTFQLEEGETASTYEPYGYKIPLEVSGKNPLPTSVTIYRSEQLKYSESINYKTDNLPALPLFNETNVITSDTEIPPSNISVTYNTKVKGV